MKKLFILAIIAMGFVSCTPESQNDENQTQATDPNVLCPPSDRNCNGIPDSEE